MSVPNEAPLYGVSVLHVLINRNGDDTRSVQCSCRCRWLRKPSSGLKPAYLPEACAETKPPAVPTKRRILRLIHCFPGTLPQPIEQSRHRRLRACSFLHCSPADRPRSSGSCGVGDPLGDAVLSRIKYSSCPAHKSISPPGTPRSGACSIDARYWQEPRDGCCTS